MVIFARYRRKIGDDEIDMAWRMATRKVTGLIVLPIAALVVLIALTFYWMSGIQSPISQSDKSLTQLLAVIVGLAIIIILEKRFKRILASPPVLSVEESREDRMLLIRFRVILIGIIAVVGLIGFLWHKSS